MGVSFAQLGHAMEQFVTYVPLVILKEQNPLKLKKVSFLITTILIEDYFYC